ncbi:MAG: hypothetical protein J6U54_23625 [Clostridiales bacterium]|nr:hypothetical protein [Clostridiales bacterium]
MSDKILVHHGVKGQEWGNRKYQYEDGSLTPLGREHYGVGDPRTKSDYKIKEYKAKAKAEAKIIRAKAKAEIAKTKAEVKAYKEKRKAEDEVDLEKIKAQRENQKEISKENKDIAKMEQDTQKQLAKMGQEQEEKKGISKSDVIKVAGGVLVAAGIGYLAYKYIKKGSVEGLDKATEGKGLEFTKGLASTPASEVASKGAEAANKATEAASKASKASTKANYYFTSKGDYAKEVSRGKLFDKLFGPTTSTIAPRSAANKATAEALKKSYEASKVTKADLSTVGMTLGNKAGRNTLDTAKAAASRSNWDKYIEKLRKVGSVKHYEEIDGMILIHSAYASDICHYGVKGQRWGVIRNLEDKSTSGRNQNVEGTTEGTQKRGSGLATDSYKEQMRKAQTAARKQAIMQVDKWARPEIKSYAMKIANDKDYLKNNPKVKQYLIQQISKSYGVEPKEAEEALDGIYDYYQKTQAAKAKQGFNKLGSKIETQWKSSKNNGGKNPYESYANPYDKKKETKTNTSKPSISGAIQTAATNAKTSKQEAATKLVNEATKMITSGFKKKKVVKHYDEGVNDMILVHSANNDKQNILVHWGIQGQKWGVRRWQYEDGTLTPEGKIHYGRNTTGKGSFGKAREASEFNRIVSEQASLGDSYRKHGKEAQARKFMSGALANVNTFGKDSDTFNQFTTDKAKATNRGALAGMLSAIPAGAAAAGVGILTGNPIASFAAMLGAVGLSTAVLTKTANSYIEKSQSGKLQKNWDDIHDKYQNMPINDLYKEFDKTFVKSSSAPKINKKTTSSK